MNISIEPLSEELLNIKFDGRLHEVEVTAFTRVLLDFAEVIKAANRQAETLANVDVRVTATGEGSFETIIKFILSHPQGALALTEVARTTAQTIGGIAIGAYHLHKYLSNRKIRETTQDPATDTVRITDIAGDSITIEGPVHSLYVGNPAVPEAIARSFTALQEDPAITGFEILDQGRASLFRAERPEFGYMAALPPTLLVESTITETVEAELRIVKIVFERNYSRKWEFIWGEHKISANIRDEAFFDSVESGLPFAQGDALQVVLEITKEYAEAAGVYWNRSYTVIEVKRRVPRSETRALFDDDEG